jgi:hypothetical protein
MFLSLFLFGWSGFFFFFLVFNKLKIHFQMKLKTTQWRKWLVLVPIVQNSLLAVLEASKTIMGPIQYQALLTLICATINPIKVGLHHVEGE